MKRTETRVLKLITNSSSLNEGIRNRELGSYPVLISRISIDFDDLLLRHAVYSLVLVLTEKIYQTLETARVSSAVQTVRISSKILRYALYFQLSSRSLDIKLTFLQRD